jgi:uncharacterized membrane protein YgdD (TMEM256/DUF423 family)
LLKGPVGNIAIRRWRGEDGLRWLAFQQSGYGAFPHSPEIGSTAAIEALERLHPAAGAIQALPWTLTYVILLFAASISFVLFSVQRRRAEYLYLGIYCVLSAAPQLLGIPLATSSSIMARSWAPVLTFMLFNMNVPFAFLFLACLCPRFRRLLQLGAVLGVLLALASAYSFAEQSHPGALFWLQQGKNSIMALFMLLAMWGLLLERRRGSFAIASTLLLNGATFFLGNFASLFRWLGMRVPVGPFLVDLRSIPGLLFVFTTLLILYQRYRDEQVRQALSDQDLAAARRMQELLLAGGAQNPAGFVVDAIYRPAREVGGDFYRTVSLDDGSLLVIVGDVSGKGLDAAMLVAVILGSLANETHRGPASLLEYLNRAVMGRTGGGFITACCARFYPNGRVVLANAGHIPPYFAGREEPMENGLPLGISHGVLYSETEIKTDQAVTFVSDGVVEARNQRGELFGFTRTAAISTQPAEAIAAAAQAFGQEDDITVLTVSLARAGVPA